MHKTSTSNSFIGEYKKPDTKRTNIQEELLKYDSDTIEIQHMLQPIVFDVSQKVVDNILNFAKNV